MNTATPSSRFGFFDADRIGVAASVLCAIHCGLAPVLLLTLPTFGTIWAHPASHALVAIFIVPLAVFSIYKGYQKHRKFWVVLVAAVGILCVLIGTILPAFTGQNAVPTAGQENPSIISDLEPSSKSEPSTTPQANSESTTAPACVDNCCPSAQISDTGKVSLHIPPAAIVTTLGGLFLIVAHIGNLISSRRCNCCTSLQNA